MTVLMAVAFLGLKFITLSQQFNKSKETCRPQRVEEVLLNSVPAILYALEPKVKFFPPPIPVVKLEVSFEMSNEKLQTVRMQQDTIQIDLEGTGKSTLRYFSSGKAPAEKRGNSVTHYIKCKIHQSS